MAIHLRHFTAIFRSGEEKIAQGPIERRLLALEMGPATVTILQNPFYAFQGSRNAQVNVTRAIKLKFRITSCAYTTRELQSIIDI